MPYSQRSYFNPETTRKVTLDKFDLMIIFKFAENNRIVEGFRIKKRNKQFTAVISTLIIVLVATFFAIYEENQVTIKANEPIIYHSISSTPFFLNTTGTENYVTIYSANTGKTTGDFTLTINFVNATFSSKTQLPYTKVNVASAEFGWTLNSGASASRDVYFSIDPNVSGFSVSLSMKSNQNPLKEIAEYPNFLQYSWNVNDFELNQ